MSTPSAAVSRSRESEPCVDLRCSRRHRWSFEGGLVIEASSSPFVVPEPYCAPEAVDPEEAFVASLSSCHRLRFLSVAAANGRVVDAREDRTSGTLGKDSSGRSSFVRVLVCPSAAFSGTVVATRADIAEAHRSAPVACFIANSVRTEVVCEPRFGAGTP